MVLKYDWNNIKSVRKSSWKIQRSDDDDIRKVIPDNYKSLLVSRFRRPTSSIPLSPVGLTSRVGVFLLIILNRHHWPKETGNQEAYEGPCPRDNIPTTPSASPFSPHVLNKNDDEDRHACEASFRTLQNVTMPMRAVWWAHYATWMHYRLKEMYIVYIIVRLTKLLLRYEYRPYLLNPDVYNKQPSTTCERFY